MTKYPQVALPDMPIEMVARMMVEIDCGAIPVVNNLTERRPLGIITDRDIVTRSIARGRDPMELVVGECMTTPVITVDEDMSVHRLVQLLELGQIRRVLVTNGGGTIVGIVSLADIARNASKRETGDLVREVSQPGMPAFVS
jgi:CBS domain-containing protein